MPNLRALLVDRDADTRAMYAEYLRRAHYDVEQAGDGREALAKAHSRQPAIIVTETWLPGISGFELCRLLRSDAATRAIPIIVVTSATFPTDRALAETAGADLVVAKPCLPDELADEMRRVLSEAIAGRPHARARQRPNGQTASAGVSLSHDASRVPLNRQHRRRVTVDPPVVPPALVCPSCDGRLTYLSSRIGGVSARHPEQWDYFECKGCRRTFEYRARTRKLRACPPNLGT
jgi:DNA-binding response OmpR family regulator